MQKLITNKTKDYDKDKESSYLKYWDVNDLYKRTMSQSLPVDGCIGGELKIHLNLI